MFVLPVLWVMAVGCSDTSLPPLPDPGPQIPLERISGMWNDDVFDVLVDSQNHLWVATDHGLYRFSTNRAPFPDPTQLGAQVTWFTDREGLPNLRCRALDELNGKVYVATWGGGIGIYSGAPTLEAVRPSDGLISGRVFDLDHDNTSVWMGTIEGVAQYIDNGAPEISDRLRSYQTELGKDKFSSIVVRTGVGGVSDSSQVWVSQLVGDDLGIRIPGGIKLLMLPTGGSQFFTPGPSSSIPTDDVAQVVFDPTRGLIWSSHIGTGAATLDMTTKSWKTYNTADGLISSLVTSVAVNSLGAKWPQGTVWISTEAGLTMMAPNGTKTNYGEGSGLSSVRVRKVVVDRNDDVWLCFVNAGTARVVPPAR